MIRRLIAATALLAAGLAHAQQPAKPVEVAGVKYSPEVTVADTKLTLNGAGIRYKFVVKVYTAGLYLQGKAATTEAVLAAPGPKRLHVVMLRDVDGNELGKLFVKGMQDNSTRAEFGKSIAGTVTMGEVFAKRKQVKTGESFGIDWVPGVGTIVMLNGEVQADPIKEPEFFRSMMRIWLGDKPADHQLKDALLGQAS